MRKPLTCYFGRTVYEIVVMDGGLIKWMDQQKNWLGQALVRKFNTQPMLICCVEGKDEGTKVKIENQFFGVLYQVSTKAVSKLDLVSDDYIRRILLRMRAEQQAKPPTRSV